MKQTEAMKLRIANDLVKYAELVEDEALISPEEMNCASLMRLAAEILADHIPDTTKMVAQPKQEPVAWITQGGKGWLRWHKSYDDNKDSVPLYTTPPQRKPLEPTVPEDANINQRISFKAGWKAAEAAHGIKE